MSKINNTKITYGLLYTLIIIGILALGITLGAPLRTEAWNGYSYESSAVFHTYNSGTNDAGGNTNVNGYNNNGNQNVGTPVILSLSPTRVISGTGAKVVEIEGGNFVPNSIVRFDGANRTTSYITSTRLAVHLTSADITRLGEHAITVRNPGGATSNVAVFTVGNTGAGATTDKDNGLGASVVKSNITGAFSGLFTWLFIGILILIIIVLWRKIFGDKERNKPFKHA